jgi:hypothetical protein
MPRGLLNPKNAVESMGGGFKEGLVEVLKSSFQVHQSPLPRLRDEDKMTEEQKEEAIAKLKERQRAPITALVWLVQRLDEETQEPLTDDKDEPVTEELVFGLGGKSLGQVHPGLAAGPEDDEEEVEDLGTEPNTEGPTIYFVNKDFRINSKSSVVYLMQSLGDGRKAEKKGEDEFPGCGFKEEYIDRQWAPDYVGLVAHMKTFLSGSTMKGEDGKDRPIAYKIVDKILKAPYEGKGKQKAGAGVGTGAGSTGAGGKKGLQKASAKTDSKSATPASAESNGSGSSDAEKVIAPILQGLSEDLDGQKLTRKALTTRVGTILTSTNVAPNLHVPVLSLLKDPKWMAANGARFDMEYNADDNTVVFGELAE